jgi:hypothetical protein
LTFGIVSSITLYYFMSSLLTFILSLIDHQGKSACDKSPDTYVETVNAGQRHPQVPHSSLRPVTPPSRRQYTTEPPLTTKSKVGNTESVRRPFADPVI